MKVDPGRLGDLLAGVSFRSHGDSPEKCLGYLVSDRFPNCEEFWKQFIIPLTRRMESYPNELGRDIGFRQPISPLLEDTAMVHYSMFMNLVFAHLHLQEIKHQVHLIRDTERPRNLLCQVPDCYTHLGTACDLVETFLEKCYFVLLRCQGAKPSVLTKLTRGEFLKLAGDWYDNSYSDFYQHYLEKGKSPPLRLLSRKHLVKEFLCNYLGQAHLWKSYNAISQPIRAFRNAAVHDINLASIFKRDETTGLILLLIPKPIRIQDYRTWREVFAVSNDSEKLSSDFVEVSEQAESDLSNLKSILNQIWERVIDQFESEFYAPDRTILRDMYGIRFETSNQGHARHTPNALH